MTSSGRSPNGDSSNMRLQQNTLGYADLWAPTIYAQIADKEREGAMKGL